MKIDLHCHTKKAKKGDPETRNVSSERFKQAMIDANIGIVAITNHNHFDIKQYYEFRNITNNIVQIWPGVELDVQGKEKNGHVIIISNPKKVEAFHNSLIELFMDKTPDNILLSLDELCNLVSGKDCIVIAHYFKPKSLDYESIQAIRENVESFRFFYEPSDFRSLGVLVNHNMQSLVGSDVKDWNEYTTNTFADIRLNVDSFEQFLLLSKKDTSVVNTLLNKKSKTNIDIGFKGEGKEKSLSVIEHVDIYNDVNIVFGTKGTGKSKVLEQIKKYYISKNIPYSYYSPNNNNDEIKTKLKINDDERKLLYYNYQNEEKAFISLSSFSDSPITPLLDYRLFIETRDKNNNKNKMLILNTMELKPFNNMELSKVKDKKNNIDYVFSKLKNIEIEKYLTEKEIKTFYSLLEKVLIGISEDYVEAWTECETNRLVNKFIKSVKEITERNTETKTKPGSSGLYNFVNTRLETLIDLEKITSAFRKKFSQKNTYIGDLEENKKLYVVHYAEMITKNTKKEDVLGKITDLRNAQKQLNKLLERVFEFDFEKHISEFNEFMADKEITSLDDFLAVRKYFSLSDCNEAPEYVPSTGEATMILLQEKLKQEVSVFILDEPEKSLGNTYVNDVIVPTIIALAKQNKVVVIATHNANIAVRTLPYNSILKKYSSSKYTTYVGNPYTNKLICYQNSEDTLDWKKESIKILEGGKEAFEERGQIYYEH